MTAETAEARDERAQAALIAVKRYAGKLRTDPAEVHAALAGLDPDRLRTLLCVALALVPPGPVDPWWQRDVIACRRAVLLAEDRHDVAA
jgi:hypothetical protein